KMTIHPAGAGTGISFRRVDLDGRPEIEAAVDNVTDTQRSTTLSKGNIRIHTVEHILASLSGVGIDNAVIELDSNEPPIYDGSAREFSRLIREAGIAPLPEKKEVFQITSPLELELGESIMQVSPHDRFKITCTSSDRQGRFTQLFSVELTPEVWEKEIAHARTFCFMEEIEVLIQKDLIKGGSLANAVVIRDDAVLTIEPMRYPDEFVRHKILDIIGDLTLLGRPLLGHVVAICPSHASNCELVRQIKVEMDRPLISQQTFTPPPEELQSDKAKKRSSEKKKSYANPVPMPLDESGMDHEELLKLLPHRYPFLMVDRVLWMDEKNIRAVKNVTLNEPYFQGHFPGHPVMPGVLQLEAMAQVAGIVLMRRVEGVGKIAYFMSADNVKWRKPVHPGDVLVIEVEIVKSRGNIGKGKGTCFVDGKVVSEALVTFMLVDS
ncbi:MAG TPA: UDP-3-O-[3-hydroxymyristoyl] N-acetylglucosamine deacetylase, partial [Verrucomicrobiales bacterium]|nr:UDP-3-O-[3-hydroxymyristoyl] N-acetylglucosamine deacetylase [Verrucomicrobiales bacterium]